MSAKKKIDRESKTRPSPLSPREEVSFEDDRKQSVQPDNETGDPQWIVEQATGITVVVIVVSIVVH